MEIRWRSLTLQLAIPLNLFAKLFLSPYLLHMQALLSYAFFVLQRAVSAPVFSLQDWGLNLEADFMYTYVQCLNKIKTELSGFKIAN